MSTSSGSSGSGHLHPGSSRKPSNPALRPMGRPHSAGSKDVKAKSRLQRIRRAFIGRNKRENGRVPVRPSCFADDRYQRRSASPEGKQRSTSVDGRSPFKINRRTGKETREGLWRPKGRCEWESDSGRMLTLQDAPVNELSRVEVEALQRLAIGHLQSMDIPVSHAVLKAGSRNVFPRLSFQKKKPLVDGSEPGLFGQPLTKVLGPNQSGGVSSPSASSSTSSLVGPRSPTASTADTSSLGSGSATPTLDPKLIPPPLSPTNCGTPEPLFLDLESNPTSRLLESLNSSPSPMAQRRLSLCPSDPQVPPIVTKAIHRLEASGVKMEGLFRIPGARSRINEIRERFDAGQVVDLEETHPHDVACLLKEFFRSLPEPLLTRELYQPFLSTRKIQNPGLRRDALRLLILLLPQANRDTLHHLLQFLSRVALHSDGIILIDGTEESGNRMTEQNLAMVLGPNLLHREAKRRSSSTGGKSEYSVMKQDTEELGLACKVMEDLIRMHLSIFTVPAKLYHEALRLILTTDSNAVDQLLKRKCIEQGLYLGKELAEVTVLRSQSSEALLKVSLLGTGSPLDEDHYDCRRSRSLSDTQKTLDEAIRNLEQYLDEELTLNRDDHYSSNDSAMGESESVLSPVQARSEPSTLSRSRYVYTSVDSAFSNNSSPTNSSEGGGTFHSTDFLSFRSDSAFTHTRMSSNISGASCTSGHSVSPAPGSNSPELRAGPYLGCKGPTNDPETVSLPALSPDQHSISSSDKHLPTPPLPQRHRSVSPVKHSHKPSGHSKPIRTSDTNKSSSITNIKKRVKLRDLPSTVGTYSPRRSPILSSKHFPSEPTLNTVGTSSDHTPTDSTTNVSSPSFSLDPGYDFEGIVI